MRRRRRPDDDHENQERWLITYSDLITLLLAFFIMMYVFSKQDKEKYDQVVGHLKTIFTGGTGVSSASGATPGNRAFEIPIKSVIDENKAIQQKLEEEVQKLPQEEKNGKTISVFSDERGIVIRILDKTFFDGGKADLKAQAMGTLDGIAPVIKDIQNQVRIEGHTDNVPINTREFKSNWELSSRRATEVVRYYIEKYGFSPLRISAVGYAEYRPVVPNDSPDNRAQNRRIEIVVIKSEKQPQQALPEKPIPNNNSQVTNAKP